MESPTQEQVREARATAGLAQPAAAKLIYSTKRTWQDWEAGIAKMHPGLWELFLLKTGQRSTIGNQGQESSIQHCA